MGKHSIDTCVWSVNTQSNPDVLLSVKVTTGAVCLMLDIERLEESCDNYQNSRRHDMETKTGKEME